MFICRVIFCCCKKLEILLKHASNELRSSEGLSCIGELRLVRFFVSRWGKNEMGDQEIPHSGFEEARNDVANVPRYFILSSLGNALCEATPAGTRVPSHFRESCFVAMRRLVWRSQQESCRLLVHLLLSRERIPCVCEINLYVTLH